MKLEKAEKLVEVHLARKPYGWMLNPPGFPPLYHVLLKSPTLPLGKVYVLTGGTPDILMPPSPALSPLHPKFPSRHQVLLCPRACLPVPSFLPFFSSQNPTHP